MQEKKSLSIIKLPLYNQDSTFQTKQQYTEAQCYTHVKFTKWPFHIFYKSTVWIFYRILKDKSWQNNWQILQSWTFAYIRLLDKPYENEVTLR